MLQKEKSTRVNIKLSMQVCLQKIDLKLTFNGDRRRNIKDRDPMY